MPHTHKRPRQWRGLAFDQTGLVFDRAEILFVGLGFGGFGDAGAALAGLVLERVGEILVARGVLVQVSLGFAGDLPGLFACGAGDFAELGLFLGEDAFRLVHQRIAVLAEIGVFGAAPGKGGADGGPHGDGERPGDERVFLVEIRGAFAGLAGAGHGGVAGLDRAFAGGDDPVAGLFAQLLGAFGEAFAQRLGAVGGRAGAVAQPVAGRNKPGLQTLIHNPTPNPRSSSRAGTSPTCIP